MGRSRSPSPNRRRDRSRERDHDRRRRRSRDRRRRSNERVKSRDRDRERERERERHRRSYSRSRSRDRERPKPKSKPQTAERPIITGAGDENPFRSNLRNFEHEVMPPRHLFSQADLQGKTPEEQDMMKLMGFCGFETTKGKKVEGNDIGAVHVILKRKYRQYMNRKGGFNRPLDFVA